MDPEGAAPRLYSPVYPARRAVAADPVAQPAVQGVCGWAASPAAMANVTHGLLSACLQQLAPVVTVDTENRYPRGVIEEVMSVGEQSGERSEVLTTFTLPRIDMGTVPAWVGAIGTVSAVSVALGQIAHDRRLRRRKEHRKQAELIAAWIGELGTPASDWDGTVVYLSNRSSLPVYGTVISLVLIQGAGPRRGEDPHVDNVGRTIVPVMPPGESKVNVLPGFTGGMNAMVGVEVLGLRRS